MVYFFFYHFFGKYKIFGKIIEKTLQYNLGITKKGHILIMKKKHSFIRGK